MRSYECSNIFLSFTSAAHKRLTKCTDVGACNTAIPVSIGEPALVEAGRGERVDSQRGCRLPLHGGSVEQPLHGWGTRGEGAVEREGGAELSVRGLRDGYSRG